MTPRLFLKVTASWNLTTERSYHVASTPQKIRTSISDSLDHWRKLFFPTSGNAAPLSKNYKTSDDLCWGWVLKFQFPQYKPIELLLTSGFPIQFILNCLVMYRIELLAFPKLRPLLGMTFIGSWCWNVTFHNIDNIQLFLEFGFVVAVLLRIGFQPRKRKKQKFKQQKSVLGDSGSIILEDLKMWKLRKLIQI